MTTIIKKVLHATFMLFVLTVNSAYKIVYGALTALLEFPAAIQAYQKRAYRRTSVYQRVDDVSRAGAKHVFSPLCGSTGDDLYHSGWLGIPGRCRHP